MIYPLLTIAAMSVAQAPVAPPPLLNDYNPQAAEHGRRIEHSVICRRDDRIAVTVADGRLTAIQVDDLPDANALAMATNAIGDAKIASFNLTCHEKSVVLGVFDKSGNTLNVLTLRYRR